MKKIIKLINRLANMPEDKGLNQIMIVAVIGFIVIFGIVYILSTSND